MTIEPWRPPLDEELLAAVAAGRLDTASGLELHEVEATPVPEPEIPALVPEPLAATVEWTPPPLETEPPLVKTNGAVAVLPTVERDHHPLRSALALGLVILLSAGALATAIGIAVLVVTLALRRAVSG